MRVKQRLLQTLVLASFIFSVLAYAGTKASKDEIFYKPKGADTAKAKRPMIVFLHQAGGTPKYIEKHFKRIADPWETYVYLPCGGTKLKVDANGDQTYDWRSKDMTNLITNIRKHIKANNVDPTLVFLSGFSAGASMALLTGIEAPDLFAGVITFSGTLPLKHLSSDKLKSAKGKYPTYIIHGNYDRTIPVAKAKADCLFLNKKGLVSELHLCNSGHEFPAEWDSILAEAMQWCNKHDTM